MKSKYWMVIAVPYCVFLQAQATVIFAGFDGAVSSLTNGARTTAAYYTASNVTASMGTYMAAGSWIGSNAGSDDQTWGSAGTPTVDVNPRISSGIDNGAFYTAVAGDVYLDYYIKNNGTGDIDLATFHFDGWRAYYNAAVNGFSLSTKAGLNTGMTLQDNIVSGQALTVQNANPGSTADYEDFNIDLTGLADHTLSPGEDVTFRLMFHGNTGGSVRIYVDNVALSGVATVPEPTSISLVVFSAVGTFALRRATR